MRRILLTLAVAAFTAALLPAAAGARTLYTNLYGDSKIAGFSIAANGVPSLLPGFPTTVGGYVQSIAITPDGRFMVGLFPFFTQNFVQSYSIDGAGAIAPVGGTVATASSSPNVISPTGTSFYAHSDTAGIDEFSLANGAITALGTAGSVPMSGPVITPDGRFLFALDFSLASIHRFAINADGTLTPLSDVAALEAGARSARITPDGRFLILVTQFAGSGHVSSYLIGADGSLTATGSSVTNSGAISDRAPITPDGKLMFVPNGNENSVSAVAIGTDGTLTHPVPDVPSGVTQPAAGAVSGDGRFLFIFSYSGDFVQLFTIAPSGALLSIGPPVSTGGGSDGSTPLMQPLQPPVAKLTVTAKGPGENSVLDASASQDSDGGTVASYAWDFGDGTKATTTSAITDHKYAKAGVYAAAVSATDDEGCSSNRIFDGQVMLCNGGPGANATETLDTPPSITRLKLTRKRISPGKATKIKFRLSESARLTFTIRKAKGGRKIGSFRANGRTGANTVKFAGKFKRRALRVGKYRLFVEARDSKGGKSTPKSARFRVR